MNTYNWLFTLLLIGFGISAFNWPFKIQEEVYSFESGDLQRSYLLHLPKDLPDTAPLLFVLHGYGGSAKGMMEYSKMNAVADKHGFAVCYPQGNFGTDKKNSWNAGYSNDAIDDVRFLSNLAQYLQKEYQLSQTNTFCTGMSNGADMSYVLACQAPAIFTAIAPVAGCMMESTLKNCASAPGIPVLEIHGTADQITLWNGDLNYSKKYGGYLGTLDIIDFWAKKNNCKQTIRDTLPDKDKNDGSFIIRTMQIDSNNKKPVWLYQLEGGKHDWPGTWGNMDINTAEEVWIFFQQFIQ